MSAQDQALQLRHTYLSCLKLAGETDSKKEDAYLRKEASDALVELRKTCNHQDTVCLRSEYGGSYTDDYDDGHPEERICLCCGLEEDSYDNKWKTLTATPFSRFEGDTPIQVKHPLNHLLTEAREVAETKGYHYFGRVKMR
jgi:ElaB/YqjD/DUF883 family membrane-anchored ribosome-binding protein